MKNFKKLFIFTAVLLPCFVFASVGNLLSDQRVKKQHVQDLRIAANDQEADVSGENKTIAEEGLKQVQPSKQDGKISFIAGFIVMAVLMAIVLYKSKDMGK
ncbi:MAG: hypothetical protein OEV78_04185 [Spirochaetia bacterium]|nr:hypothetical protein [Spirochaetia bacterium]